MIAKMRKKLSSWFSSFLGSDDAARNDSAERELSELVLEAFEGNTRRFGGGLYPPNYFEIYVKNRDYEDFFCREDLAQFERRRLEGMLADYCRERWGQDLPALTIRFRPAGAGCEEYVSCRFEGEVVRQQTELYVGSGQTVSAGSGTPEYRCQTPRYEALEPAASLIGPMADGAEFKSIFPGATVGLLRDTLRSERPEIALDLPLSTPCHQIQGAFFSNGGSQWVFEQFGSNPTFIEYLGGTEKRTLTAGESAELTPGCELIFSGGAPYIFDVEGEVS